MNNCGCTVKKEIVTYGEVLSGPAQTGVIERIVYCPTHAKAFEYKEALDKILADKCFDGKEHTYSEDDDDCSMCGC